MSLTSAWSLVIVLNKNGRKQNEAQSVCVGSTKWGKIIVCSKDQSETERGSECCVGATKWGKVIVCNKDQSETERDPQRVHRINKQSRAVLHRSINRA